VLTKKRRKRSGKLTNLEVFIGIFLLIVLFMLFSYWRQANVKLKLRIPFNKGIHSLSTVEGKLVARQIGGDIFVFDWNNLKAGYETVSTPSQESLLLTGERIISVVEKTFRLSDLQGIMLQGHTLPHPADTVSLISNDFHDSVVAMSSKTLADTITYTIEMLSIEDNKVILLDVISGDASDLQIKAVDLSNDGRTIAVVGCNGKEGYCCVIDVSARKLLWEKKYAEMPPFFSVAFNSGGGQILAGTVRGHLAKIQSDNGSLAGKIQLIDRPRTNNNTMTVKKIVISPDGSMLAATIDPQVFLVDVESLQIKNVVSGSYKLVGGVCFSPAGQQLATSDLRASGVITIINLDNIKGQ